MARLEGAYEQVSQRFANIDLRFEGLDRNLGLRFDTLDKKIEMLDGKIDQRFMWTVGIVITTWVTTIASIHLHH